ncbi:putative FBD domain-containing protein [Medicago truncatula]|uniref:Putative FBD domain-containing protein n=1 Tax=Medicago truncatula TaxID=3880 RepID=A0A396HRC0_MEDTR|nr:FBD-associated F-box protein At3g52670 [Medicago truncatula]RHN54444.1 putative FBD domain-containing protein [Medicago truncatula]
MSVGGGWGERGTKIAVGGRRRHDRESGEEKRKWLRVRERGLWKTHPIEEINSYYIDIPVFENLTVLRLYWIFHVLFDWDDVMKMLQSCPKPQDFTISKWTSDSETKEDWKYPHHVPECVSSHLTTCNILHYLDVEPDFRFARYIFQNARLLQDMKIHPISYRPKRELYEELSSCPRISNYTNKWSSNYRVHLITVQCMLCLAFSVTKLLE